MAQPAERHRGQPVVRRMRQLALVEHRRAERSARKMPVVSIASKPKPQDAGASGLLSLEQRGKTGEGQLGSASMTSRSGTLSVAGHRQPADLAIQ